MKTLFVLLAAVLLTGCSHDGQAPLLSPMRATIPPVQTATPPPVAVSTATVVSTGGSGACGGFLQPACPPVQLQFNYFCYYNPGACNFGGN